MILWTRACPPAGSTRDLRSWCFGAASPRATRGAGADEPGARGGRRTAEAVPACLPLSHAYQGHKVQVDATVSVGTLYHAGRGLIGEDRTWRDLAGLPGDRDARLTVSLSRQQLKPEPPESERPECAPDVAPRVLSEGVDRSPAGAHGFRHRRLPHDPGHPVRVRRRQTHHACVRPRRPGDVGVDRPARRRTQDACARMEARGDQRRDLMLRRRLSGQLMNVVDQDDRMSLARTRARQTRTARWFRGVGVKRAKV